MGSIDLLYRARGTVRTLRNGEKMIRPAENDSGKMREDAAPPDSVEVFCYSQHLRGLIRTRVQQLVSSECIELRLSSVRNGPSRRCGFPGGQWTAKLTERLDVSVQAGERYRILRAISHNGCHGLSVQVETNREIVSQWWMASPAKDHPVLLKKTAMRKALIFIFWMKVTGRKCNTTAKVARTIRCATSVASIRQCTIASRMAPVLSTLTCRSSTR